MSLYSVMCHDFRHDILSAKYSMIPYLSHDLTRHVVIVVPQPVGPAAAAAVTSLVAVAVRSPLFAAVAGRRYHLYFPRPCARSALHRTQTP